MALIGPTPRKLTDAELAALERERTARALRRDLFNPKGVVDPAQPACQHCGEQSAAVEVTGPLVMAEAPDGSHRLVAEIFCEICLAHGWSRHWRARHTALMTAKGDT